MRVRLLRYSGVQSSQVSLLRFNCKLASMVQLRSLFLNQACRLLQVGGLSGRPAELEPGAGRVLPSPTFT